MKDCLTNMVRLIVMIDANQDKKCERNNQIVESFEKLVITKSSMPILAILDRLIKIQNEKILEENINQFFNYKEKKPNGDMSNS